MMVFAIHRHESATGIHVFPHPEPLFHLSPHPLPLGCLRALALGSLLHTSNLHWSSILYMVIYVFQCYCLKSSHPSLLPQSLLFTSVCLLLPLYIILSVPHFLFLNNMSILHSQKFCYHTPR